MGQLKKVGAIVSVASFSTYLQMGTVFSRSTVSEERQYALEARIGVGELSVDPAVHLQPCTDYGWYNDPGTSPNKSPAVPCRRKRAAETNNLVSLALRLH